MQEQMKKYKLICKTLTENGLALEELNNYDNFKDTFTQEEFTQIIREKQNRKNKRNRTKQKFREILQLQQMIPNSKIVFISIMPNDELLNQKEETRVKKIEIWLKKHFWYSIVNKDFGSKTEREHYHAIALTTEELEQLFHEDGRPKLSNKGLPIYELVNKDFKTLVKMKKEQFEPTLCLVDISVNDINKTINYLLKLNNHSNKLSTRNRLRIITNTKYDLFVLASGLKTYNSRKKREKILIDYFFKNNKNASYDTLNKRSVSPSKNEIELSVQDFIKNYCNEL